MFRKLAIMTATAIALIPTASFAAGGSEGHIENIQFSFDGPLANSTRTSFSVVCRSTPRSAQPVMV